MSVKSRERKISLKELVNSLAHEIKNPLSTIKLNLELIRNDMKDGLTPQQKVNFKRADIAIKEVERIATILNDFIRFFLLKKVEKKEVDVNLLLKDVTDSLEYIAKEKNIVIIRDFDLSIAKVSCDPNLMKQVFYNVILNAIQSSGRNQSIVVSSKEDENYVVVKVIDNGIGIERENYDKVFMPFFTTKSYGSGLGLSFAKRVIQLHDGNIYFESEVGKGTTFVIELKK
jgi:two-component system sensor histidine kinase HydH